MKKFNQLVLTRESMELTEEVSAIPEEEVAVVENEEQAEAVEDTAVLEADMETGDDIVEGITDAEQAVADLEALSDVVKEAEVDGGLTPMEAKAVEVTHESIMSSLGLSHRHGDHVLAPVYEPENYAVGNAMRGHATRMTHENLQTNIKTVGNMIAIGGAKLVQFIKDMIAKIMEMVKRFEMMISLLERQVNAIPQDAQLDAKEVRSGDTLAVDLSMGNRAGPLEAFNGLRAAVNFIAAGSSDIQFMTAALSSGKYPPPSALATRMNNYAKLSEKLAGGEYLAFRPDRHDFEVKASPVASEVTLATKDQMLDILTEARHLDTALKGTRERLSRATEALSHSQKKDIYGESQGNNERDLTKTIYAVANTMNRYASRQVSAGLRLVRLSIAHHKVPTQGGTQGVTP